MWRASGVLALVTLVACERSPSPARAGDGGSPLPSALAGEGPGLRDASAGDGSQDPDAAAAPSNAAYASAKPVSGKSVGHTSVVFKLGLEGGLTVAYKPRSTRGGYRYRGEVAAYRIAKALGLENVPFAMPRSFSHDALQAAVGREAIFSEVVKEPNGDVRGALVPWIKGLEFLPLETDEWMPKWRGWLKAGGVVPDDQRALAAQISDVLAFDQVTGNWDRWSGGNVGIDRPHGMLLFIDNDGAFLDPPPAKEMKWPTTLFEGVDRFSRSFVAALRGLDVASAVGEEASGEPLLSARIVAQTEARRRRVLASIDAKIAKLGEPNVLAFE